MSKPRDQRQKDLFRPALDQIIDMQHPLVRLAEKVDWGFIDGHFRSVCHEGPGQPPLPTRLVAARTFKVSVASVVKWSQRFRATGSAAAKPMGRRQARSLAPQRRWLLARLEAAPDVTLRALVMELGERGVVTSYGLVWRIVHGLIRRGSCSSTRPGPRPT